MTPEEEKRIVLWSKAHPENIRIRLITTKDSRSRLLADFCDRLTTAAPNVALLTEQGDGKELPSLEIHPRLRYHAVPLDRELEPFLQALAGISSGLSGPMQDDLTKLDLPAFLQVFIAPTCPHCPLTVQQLLPVALASPLIHLAVVDGALFPERAERLAVRSVPTVLLDEQFRWTGSFPLNELVRVIAKREPARLGAASLESMLKEGNASAVAEMMLKARKIFPAFLDLLVDEKMFVRLGAMVVMEEIVARNRGLAAQVVTPLWERFDRAGEQAQGDMLHVIGEVADPRVVPLLEAILNGPYGPDVREAARDALARITAL
jgi:thiol-disulfide isomerase/thioredoxin